METIAKVIAHIWNNIEVYRPYMTIFIIGVPSLFIVIHTYKSYDTHLKLRKIFNLRRELKRLKMNKYTPPRTQDPQQTYIGQSNNGTAVYVPNDAKHIFVCGTTGSGKTVALSNFIKSAVDYDYPALIVDGKGDIGQNSLLDIVQKLGINRKIYVVNLNDPEQSAKYNPFKNATPSIIKDMLINLTDWSEEHYKLNTERYLQRLIFMMSSANVSLSFVNIINHIPVNCFARLNNELLKKQSITKEQHIQNIEIAKASGEIAENASSRFATIIESELGSIFDEDGIDIYEAFSEKAIILFILNPLIYPEISPLFGRLVLIDSKKAISKLFGRQQRTFFIFDEINVYASSTLLDLVNKSRSANVTCILATQSLSDLDFANGEYFKEQIIENCNNYIVLRQNSAVNAEKWANILGTRKNLDVTFQITANSNNGMTQDTGFGSARRVREFLYHPDEIKTFSVGKGIFMCKDNNTHTKVTIHKPF